MSLDPDRRRAELVGLPDWRYSMRAFHAAFEAPTVQAAIAVIEAVTSASADVASHVCLDWRRQYVFVRLRDDDRDGVDEVDLRLAGEISAAVAVTAVPRPDLCRVVEIAIDTDDPGRIAATWAAALGYEIDADGNVWDRFRRGPDVWFQGTDRPATSTFHVDVTVADDQGDQVVDEVVDAGGTRIDERFRPSFTVLADADGNRVCICTQLGRD